MIEKIEKKFIIYLLLLKFVIISENYNKFFYYCKLGL